MKMALLTLHRKQFFRLAIPYWVFLNEQPIGIMQSKEVSIQMPEGEYDLGIRILFRLFKWQFHIGGSSRVRISEGEHLHLQIKDKERWWNILFDIDLVFWLAKFFFTLPHPWNIVYEVVSNGFFAIWILRIWLIRKRYFQIEPITDK